MYAFISFSRCFVQLACLGSDWKKETLHKYTHWDIHHCSTQIHLASFHFTSLGKTASRKRDWNHVTAGCDLLHWTDQEMGRADFESREFEAFLTRSKDFTMIISASINFTPWSFAFGQDWTKRVEEQKAMKLEDELSLEFNKHLAFLSYDDFGLSNPP